MADEYLGFMITVAQFLIVGIVMGAFILFRDKIPVMPRKYWKAIIYQKKDNKDIPIKETKAWILREGGVEKCRVLLRGFTGTWRGVNLDRAILKTLNEEGVLELYENVPDLLTPSNYTPKNPLLTQKEKFIEDEEKNISIAVLSALQSSDIIVKGMEGDKEVVGVNQQRFKEVIDNAVMRVRENLHKNSRIADLDDSAWLTDNLSMKKAQKNRVAGDNWLEKYMPFIVLIVLGFFMYLAYDSLGKSFTKASENYSGVVAYNTQQVVQACGGQYIPMGGGPSNQTAAPKQGGLIPFIT